MKKFLFISMLALMVTGCKKEKSPTPTPTPATVTCQSSSWDYEVILTNPVAAGTFQIIYLDAYNNTMIDTSVTSTWTYNVGTPFSSTPVFSVNVLAGPNFACHIPAGTNLTNSIKVNIYRDGTLVQTTGVAINFCQDNSATPCAVGSVNSITKNYSCN